MLSLPKLSRNSHLYLDAYRDVFQACIEVVGDKYTFTTLHYAERLSNEKARERMCHFVEEVLINKTNVSMSYGKRLSQEAMQQGVPIRNMEIARTALTKGYAPTEKRTLTGISPEV